MLLQGIPRSSQSILQQVWRLACVTVDAASSGGLVPPDMARRSLKDGKSSMSRFSLTNRPKMSQAHTSQGHFGRLQSHAHTDLCIPLSTLGFLSLDRICHSLDSPINGYDRGQGFAVIIINPVGGAIRDGDSFQEMNSEIDAAFWRLGVCTSIILRKQISGRRFAFLNMPIARPDSGLRSASVNSFGFGSGQHDMGSRIISLFVDWKGPGRIYPVRLLEMPKQHILTGTWLLHSDARRTI